MPACPLHSWTRVREGPIVAACGHEGVDGLAEWLDVDAVAPGPAPPGVEGVELGAQGPSEVIAEPTLPGLAISTGPPPSAEPGLPGGVAHRARRDGSSGVELDVAASRW